MVSAENIQTMYLITVALSLAVGETIVTYNLTVHGMFRSVPDCCSFITSRCNSNFQFADVKWWTVFCFFSIGRVFWGSQVRLPTRAFAIYPFSPITKLKLLLIPFFFLFPFDFANLSFILYPLHWRDLLWGTVHKVFSVFSLSKSETKFATGQCLCFCVVCIFCLLFSGADINRGSSGNCFQDHLLQIHWEYYMDIKWLPLHSQCTMYAVCISVNNSLSRSGYESWNSRSAQNGCSS